MRNATISRRTNLFDKIQMFFQSGMSLKRTKVAIEEYEKPINLFENDQQVIRIRIGRTVLVSFIQNASDREKRLRNFAKLAREKAPTVKQAVDRIRGIQS